MRPFVVLALPRTGTKMLADALGSHPDLSHVVHEFKGSESDYWEHPYVLSNYLKDWMLEDGITRLCLYREDAVAGALSLLLMPYTFPDGQFDVPVDEVQKAAEWRRDQERQFREVSGWSFSYEQLCGGNNISELPEWFCRQFAKLVEVPYSPLTTVVGKQHKPMPRNIEDIQWLPA